MTILFTIGWLMILLGLVSGTLMFWTSPLLPQQKKYGRSLPLISIIIPARNEEGRIGHLLQSLRQQHFQHFELIVVDDDSTDQTALLAQQYGATVLTNEKVEHMGSGKSHACWTGAKAAQGQWLLFLDADTAFVHEDSLEALLSSYVDHGARGILSLQPYHTIKRGYENLSAIFNMIVMIGINIFTPWRNRFQAAGAFGPCILCCTEDYFQVGGHNKAKSAIMDDFALAQAFREQQLPIYCYGGKDIISFRMYPEGWKQMTEGWTKTFAKASESTHGLVMLFINLWMCGGILAVVGLISAFILLNGWLIAISIVFYLLFAWQTAILAKKTGNFYAWFFLGYPLLLIYFTAVFVYSLYRTKVLRSVTWKGRKIKV